jgi:hypothetical protein
MKAYMGNFGELTDPSTITPIPSTGATVVSTAASLAEKSIDQSFDKAAALLRSQEVQSFIEEHNLAPYIQDLTKERIKTFLALLGLWSVYKAIKSPVGLAAIAGAAIYVVTSNKEKVIQKVSDKVAVTETKSEISKA